MPCANHRGSTEVLAILLLDSNVVSELMLTNPVFSVIERVARQPSPTLFLSSMSEAKLRYGAEILPSGQRRERLVAEIDGLLQKDFAGRILPFNSIAGRAYAVTAAARRVPDTPSVTPTAR